jgi:hypothetical protein
MPVKPKTAAMIAMMKNASAQLSMTAPSIKVVAARETQQSPCRARGARGSSRYVTFGEGL